MRSALASSRHDNGIEGLFLDRFAGTNEALRVGNILAMPDLLQRPAAQSRELDMALELFAPMRHGHVAAPQLRWSYYLSASGDFMTMFPFAPSVQLVAPGDYTSMQELIGGRLGYDVFRSGTPERNPGAQPYWTDVYQDAGGAGPLVSYAAPVYADGRFAGVIGTDILLGYLTGFLDRIEWPIGGVWIVSQSGDVLAARGHGEPNQVPALPAVFAQLPLSDLLADTGQFRPVGGQLILAESLAGTPFSLLYALPSAELGSLFLPRVKPYALILATLMLTLLAAYILLQRRFVRPALKLVRHIQNESDGGSRPGMVPAPWQPWFAAVSEAFGAGRSLQARLAASEARLKAAAESIPDGLAIFDPDDRLVFHNSRYPEHLTDNARATMALGKPWLVWVREAAELGPIYHPDMGPDYLADRIADRERGVVDREHRLSDGRWVRVRGYRMHDGGHVQLTTDVSEERRLRQERNRVATAMAQVGDSIEITDTSYRVAATTNSIGISTPSLRMALSSSRRPKMRERPVARYLFIPAMCASRSAGGVSSECSSRPCTSAKV